MGNCCLKNVLVLLQKVYFLHLKISIYEYVYFNMQIREYILIR